MKNNGEHEHHDGSAGTPGVAYERRDASFRGVISFAIGLAIATGIIQLVMWGMLRYFDKLRTEKGVAAHAQVSAPAPPVTAPRLQSDPAADMQKFRASEERVLDSYSWADEQHSAVRIPIERAKQILLQRGLPVVDVQGPPAPLQVRPSGPYPAQAAEVKPEASR